MNWTSFVIATLLVTLILYAGVGLFAEVLTTYGSLK